MRVHRVIDLSLRVMNALTLIAIAICLALLLQRMPANRGDFRKATTEAQKEAAADRMLQVDGGRLGAIDFPEAFSVTLPEGVEVRGTLQIEGHVDANVYNGIEISIPESVTVEIPLGVAVD